MSYEIYHPGSQTFMSASECVLVDTDYLPAEFDEWVEFVEDNMHMTEHMLNVIYDSGRE